MSRKPYLIGVAGPSGAGKSYLAHHLAQRLHAPVLALDRYYRDLSHLPPHQRARWNFDEPSALEYERLISDACTLGQGKAIEVPWYDFSAHQRTAMVCRFEPADFVILEGLFTLYWPRLRELLGTRIYLDEDRDICLQRRLHRDARDWGRSPEAVIAQFRSTVAPMTEKYVRPTRIYADLFISGSAPVAASVEHVVAHLEARPLLRRAAYSALSR